jgi:hypothetical protein
VEDHGGSFLLPIRDAAFLARFPDLQGAELAALVEMAHAAHVKPACRPLDRDAWPAACESRIAADLRALRAIADDAGVETQR